MTLPRDEVEALLPFLANGTLEGEERIQVEQAVAADAALARELEALKAIRQTMQTTKIGASPGEFGLARLMRDVDRDAQPAETTTSPVSRPLVWQIAAALLMAVVIGQAVLMSGPDDSVGFELAGGSEAVLTVAFFPDVPEQALRAILLEAGVEIVSGPSALGLYQLGLLEGTAIDDAETILRAAGGIVESVVRADE